MNTAKLLSGFLMAAWVMAVALPALGQDQAVSQEEAAPDLARQAQNPIANLISLPIQNNANFNVGRFDRNQNTLNFQPVIPFNFSGVNLITRTIVPVLYRPELDAPTGGTSGLGDINATFFFSPAGSGKVTWGVGPAVYIPTATADKLGSGKWSAGPSAVVLAMPGKWVVGALASNVWSFAGGDVTDDDVNSFLLQYFINYNLPNQWYLSSAPILTANWEQDSGNQWTIPVGGGFGKIFSIGSQPVNGQMQAFWNAVHPDVGALVPGNPIGGLPEEASGAGSWTLRLQLQLLFPR
jgi:hypothetical protein